MGKRCFLLINRTIKKWEQPTNQNIYYLKRNKTKTTTTKTGHATDGKRNIL